MKIKFDKKIDFCVDYNLPYTNMESSLTNYCKSNGFVYYDNNIVMGRIISFNTEYGNIELVDKLNNSDNYVLRLRLLATITEESVVVKRIVGVYIETRNKT